MVRSLIPAFLTTMSLALSSVALANESKITKGYYSMDAMGCMLMRECTKDVKEVFSMLDISSNYKNMEEFTPVTQEFHNMLVSLNQIGVKVYLADERYFPKMHRGVYHTVGNNFKNSMIAIIHNEEDVPILWRTLAERTYPESAVPWEAEASWAGRTEGMTMKALQSCANGTMWTDYELTPLTRQWLKEEGFIK